MKDNDQKILIFVIALIGLGVLAFGTLTRAQPNGPRPIPPPAVPRLCEQSRTVLGEQVRAQVALLRSWGCDHVTIVPLDDTRYFHVFGVRVLQGEEVNR